LIINIWEEIKIFKIFLDRYQNKNKRYHLKFNRIAGIVKLKNGVSILQETTKRFVAQVEAFQTLSQRAQDDLKSAITGGSHEMATRATGAFYEKVDPKIHEILKVLDQSVHHASDVLERMSRKRKVKGVVLSTLLMCIALLLGFGGGYAYQERRAHSLSKAFLETVVSGKNTLTKQNQKSYGKP
jgi:hypothetical protein